MRTRKLGIKSLVVFLFLIAMSFALNLTQVDATIYSNLPVSYIDENFPESYQGYIDALKEAHPNWVFKAVHTGLDWDTVVSHESYEVNSGISLVPDSFASEWKRDGVDYYQDGSYVTASIEAVAYAIDPRNWLNDSGIFMFETLSFSSSTQSVSTVQSVLSTTNMGSSSYSSKYKYYGTWYSLGTTYAQLIFDLSEQVGINPVHIASRIRQENSGDIVNNSLINGDYGVYNFFNIGAYQTSSASAVANGVAYASSKGWTSVSAGILGGINYIYNNYVKWGQNTIYFERFDVNNSGSAQWLLGTGYMTYVLAPKNESSITYSSYNSLGMLDSAFEFLIPVYENMPDEVSSMPLDSDVYFTDDNTTVYLDDPSDSGVTDEFWIRNGPSDNSTYTNIIEKIYETEEGGANRTHFTRIGIGQNTLYDKVQFEDGRIGYVLKKWIYEYSYVKVESVSLNTTYKELSVGDTLSLSATISPKNAENTSVSWSSSDTSVATVDSSGKVTALSDGVATITVKTEDQSKTAICTINVVSNRVTGVSLNKTTYILNVSDAITISPKITPSGAENTNYTITTSNSSVASVNGNKITAVSEGEAIITVTTEDGGYTAQATVIVTSQDKYIYLSTLNSDDKIISGLDLNNNLLSDIKEDIITEYEIEAISIDGNTLSDTDRVGTGTRIRFLSNDTLIDEYTVLIYGDVDGNGVINSRDLLVLQRYIYGQVTLDDIQVTAAIIDKVSQEPRAVDLLKIQRHILGLYTIEQ